MATHDYVIANQSGAAFRTDLNNALAAIVSNNSNSSEPTTMYAYQWWADTSNAVMKIRNSANNAWIELFQLDGTLTLEDGTESTPALAFRDDLNTGIYSSAADTVDITTGGSRRVSVDSSGRLLVGTGTGTGKFIVQDSSLPKIQANFNGAAHFELGVGGSGGGFAITTGHSTTFNHQPFANRGTDTNLTTRLTITSTGNLESAGLIVGASGLTQVDNAQSLISQSSVGSATQQYFIGNAQIQVSSDRRIKENIVDTSLNAITELNKVRVVDFNWNDPQDKAINNKNARGKWTGCIAQEIVNIFPHSVNAPRPKGKEIDYDSEHLWTMEYEHLVPVLIKAVQELSTKVAALESL